MRLHERVAVITGGGHGLGRAIGLKFASEGAAIAVAGPTEDTIQATTKQIRDSGGRAISCVTDVSDEASIAAMVAVVLREFGRIDILVNNAGIIGPTSPVTRVERADWDQTLAINLTGAFLCAKHTLPVMMERRSGRIINIASVAGLHAYALRSPYSVSKWGMIGLSKTLAEEAGPFNITVNTIAPGPVRGERMSEVIRRRAAEMGIEVEEVERQFIGPAALKRMVEEEDIAATALFIASDDARNITGETLTVAAGYHL